MRSVENAVAEGMPHAVIFGRVKFQVAEVEPWLEQAGYLSRRGATTLPDDESARRRANAAGP